jgi:hypothetical protein
MDQKQVYEAYVKVYEKVHEFEEEETAIKNQAKLTLQQKEDNY